MRKKEESYPSRGLGRSQASRTGLDWVCLNLSLFGSALRGDLWRSHIRDFLFITTLPHLLTFGGGVSYVYHLLHRERASCFGASAAFSHIEWHRARA